jgi:multicomponent Na+:H+ antiporter subunit A
LVALLVAHLIAGGGALVAGRRLGRAVFVLTGVPLAITFVAMVPAWGDAGAARLEELGWVDGLGLRLSFRLDGFAVLMGTIVGGIGALIAWYSAFYFKAQEGLARLAGLLVLFGGAMLGLVWADDIFTLFVFWELTSVTSFLLIGWQDRSASARASATTALLVTAAGGLAMLAGFILLAREAGTSSLSGIVAASPRGAAVDVALVLVLLGAFTKSAQFPFHFWLPGAMAAPTPVSAYLHSATMVKAGLVLVARLAPSFADADPWRPMIAVGGIGALLVGALSTFRQHDAKLFLAFGTVSQLGLIMLLLGAGTKEATFAGVALLFGHALFKAALFLAVGIVDHSAGTRDMRELTGLGQHLPAVAALTGLAALSMAGIPPLLGFIAKEKALEALLHDHGWYGAVVLVAAVAGSALTVAYTLRLWRGLFGGDGGGGQHPPSLAFVAPLAVLAGAGAVVGLAASTTSPLVTQAAVALDPEAGKKLALWAGLNTALVLSVLIVAAGAALGLSRLLPPRLAWLPAGTRVWDTLYDATLRSARVVTGFVQPGSLPAYVAVIWSAFAIAALTPLVMGAELELDGLELANSPGQAVVAVLAGVMAIAVVAARRRFVAALLLGGVGYGLALIFLLYGAPDLALTQFLVETMTLVVFLLVLRLLPDEFGAAPDWVPAGARLVLAGTVGVAASLIAVLAATARTGPTPSARYAELSLPEAGGRNVVNVILVDFRGIDTLGEITVLALAAAGVANLVRAALRAQRRAGEPAPPGRPRSLVLQTTVGAITPVLALVAVFVTFRGHNAPGGGFAGGLIAAAGLLLRYLSGGNEALRRLARHAAPLVGVGLAMAVLTGLAALLAGDAYLESGIATVDVPLVGDVKLVSSAVFDLGVFVLVIGVVLGVLSSLGAGRRVTPGGAP